MRRIFQFMGLALGLAVCAIACQQSPVEQAPTTAEQPSFDPVERGAYLVNAIGCDDCHTPKKMGPMGPEPDMSRRFMGHPADLDLPEYNEAQVAPGQWFLTNNDLTAWVGPWGISYSANITSSTTGIGAWTEENFVRAIREGVYKGIEGSRPLLPPMPWPSYRNLTDEDLKAIYAYLKTTDPIDNVVPMAKLNPPPPG